MIEAFFLPGSQGARFAIYHPPAADVAERGGVLYVPPFAEEMNKAVSYTHLDVYKRQASRSELASSGVKVKK